MKEIFEEYGGVIITALVGLCIIGAFLWLLGPDSALIKFDFL